MNVATTNTTCSRVYLTVHFVQLSSFPSITTYLYFVRGSDVGCQELTSYLYFKPKILMWDVRVDIRRVPSSSKGSSRLLSPCPSSPHTYPNILLTYYGRNIHINYYRDNNRINWSVESWTVVCKYSIRTQHITSVQVLRGRPRLVG